MSAYVDESLRISERRYLMAAVFISHDRVDEQREELRRLLCKGQRRLHWRDENDRRREQLVEALAESRPIGVVVVGASLEPGRQERGRRKCMERLLWTLSARRPEAVIFERRHAELDARDRKMVAALRAQQVFTGDIRTSWEHPDNEPLLWLPDIVAGAASLAESGQEKYWKEIGAGLSIERFTID